MMPSKKLRSTRSTPKRDSIMNAVHEAAKDLHDAGVIPAATMREFDALCVPIAKRYGARDVKRIRTANRVSQAVFAACLGVGKTTVQQWEQGLKTPQGPSRKLLQIVERKGLQAVI